MLPSGVDANGIRAKMKHGTLELYLPKTKDADSEFIGEAISDRDNTPLADDRERLPVARPSFPRSAR
jgi:hypothetical protein